MQPKRLFITGMTGFVGSHILEYLHSIQHSYEVFGSSYKGDDQFAEQYLQSKKHLIPLDMTQADKVSATVQDIQPEYVIHLAALSSAHQSYAQVLHTIQTNLQIQFNLLEALKSVSGIKKILLITSAEIYGYVKPNELPINEQAEFRPGSPYGVSKVTQDRMGYMYHKAYQLPCVMLRPFNHTGARRPDAFVVSSFAKQIAAIEAGQQKPILKVGNLEAKRDFTHVQDMVRAYMLALESCVPGEAYNIGSANSIGIQTILDKLLSKTDVSIEVQNDPDRMRPSDVPELRCDNRKFIEATGWSMQYSIDSCLDDVLQYWRHYYQL